MPKMFTMLAIAAGLAAAAPATATVVTVGYDAAAPISNFGAPTNASNTTAYSVTSSQDASNIYVTLQTTGAQAANALDFANVYFGGDTLVGIEITNDRAFIPGGNGTYYSLAGTGFTTSQAGSAAAGDLAISFVLPFSFLENDPLGMGFAKLSGHPGANFTRLSLSQSFGYSVAGGQSYYGTNRLGAFTVPLAAVPEPATWAMMLVGLGIVAGSVRYQRRPSRAITA